MAKFDFKKKKFLVMGLGLWGAQVGVTRFLVKHNARVLVTDIRKEEELAESLALLKNCKNVEYVIGRHRSEDFANADCIIKSAGIPDSNKYLEITRKNNIPIKTDISLFFELSPTTQIIGVTGTKGKSTVSSLLYAMLAKMTKNVYFGGNIGRGGSIVEELETMNNESIVVLELSSWQLESLAMIKKSPQYAVITNVFPEHLNIYPTFEEYVTAKKCIFSNQRADDVLLLNYNDPLLCSFATEAKSTVVYYGYAHEPQAPITGLLREGAFYYKGERVADISSTRLKGEHTAVNIVTAVTLAKIFNVKNKIIQEIINNFEPLFGRLQLVDQVKDVVFYNDTAATNPHATIAAIETLARERKLVVIAGGVDKNLSYRDLARVISEKVKALVLFEGSASAKIIDELDFLKQKNSRLPSPVLIKNVPSMGEACTIAWGLATAGDAIVLSPAAASFNIFKNEKDRGEQFIREVHRIKHL